MVHDDQGVNKKDVHVNEVIYNSLYYNFYHDAQQKIITSTVKFSKL